MTLTDEIKARPHLVERFEGRLLLEPLWAVAVADRIDGAPTRFVRHAQIPTHSRGRG
jgi:hypothetical protein